MTEVPSSSSETLEQDLRKAWEERRPDAETDKIIGPLWALAQAAGEKPEDFKARMAKWAGEVFDGDDIRCKDAIRPVVRTVRLSLQTLQEPPAIRLPKKTRGGIRKTLKGESKGEQRGKNEENETGKKLYIPRTKEEVEEFIEDMKGQWASMPLAEKLAGMKGLMSYCEIEVERGTRMCEQAKDQGGVKTFEEMIQEALEFPTEVASALFSFLDDPEFYSSNVAQALLQIGCLSDKSVLALHQEREKIKKIRSQLKRKSKSIVATAFFKALARECGLPTSQNAPEWQQNVEIIPKAIKRAYKKALEEVAGRRIRKASSQPIPKTPDSHSPSE